jgi:hypothetical protein
MAEVIKMNENVCTVSELLKRSSNLKSCIILGIDAEDNHFFGIASLSKEEAVYSMELCKHFILKMEE